MSANNDKAGQIWWPAYIVLGLAAAFGAFLWATGRADLVLGTALGCGLIVGAIIMLVAIGSRLFRSG